MARVRIALTLLGLLVAFGSPARVVGADTYTYDGPQLARVEAVVAMTAADPSFQASSWLTGSVGPSTLAVWPSTTPTDADLATNFPRDYFTKDTIQQSAMFSSEGEARSVARTHIGSNPVEIEPGKLRSADGRWQYRAKEVDTSDNHIHLERLDPCTGFVIENWHFYWPEGGGR